MSGPSWDIYFLCKWKSTLFGSMHKNILLKHMAPSFVCILVGGISKQVMSLYTVVLKHYFTYESSCIISLFRG